MADEIEEIVDAAIKAANNEWKENATVDWGPLKKSAIVFCNAYDKYNNNNIELQSAFKTSIISQLKGEGLFGNSDSDPIAQRTIYLLAFEFQYNLQRYCDKSPTEVIYVTDNGEVYRGPIKQIALTATFDNGQLNRGRVANISVLQDKGDFSKETISNEVLAAYQGIQDQMKNYFTKLDAFLSKKNLKNKDYANEKKSYYGIAKYRNKEGEIEEGGIYLKKQKAIIQIQLEKVTRYFQILNYGDLSEALIATQVKFKKEIDEAGTKLTNAEAKKALANKLMIESLEKVSNAAAILKEDVENLAIKSNKSGLPGLKQFRKAAGLIQNSKEPIDSEEIKNQIDQHKEGTRNKILNSTALKQTVIPEFNGSKAITLKQLLKGVYSS